MNTHLHVLAYTLLAAVNLDKQWINVLIQTRTASQSQLIRCPLYLVNDSALPNTYIFNTAMGYVTITILWNLWLHFQRDCVLV